jgi:CRISPR-associated endonuclease Cas1
LSTANPQLHPRRQAKAEPSSPIEVQPIPVRDGVVSLSGFGLRVSVDKAHLILADGIGNKRREGRFARATCGIRRLVIRSNAGFITLEALHWLHDIGASFLQLSYDGEVITISGPRGLDDARLRRAQALAPWTGTGPALMREILREKLIGQGDLLVQRFPQSDAAISEIRKWTWMLDQVEALDQMRSAEARAAAVYWTVLAGVPIKFVRRDEARVPDHWRTFGTRLATSNARNAINPANALLNYLYSLLEAEVTIAAQAVGLDPGLGILHVDTVNRNSLAYDLMEPARPLVDRFLLDLLDRNAFTATNFFENGQGVCRVLPPLTHALIESLPAWRRTVAPIVERVSHTLRRDRQSITMPSNWLLSVGRTSKAEASKQQPGTPLTQENRHASLGYKFRRPGLAGERTTLTATCRLCGTALPEGDHRRICASCLPTYRMELAQRMHEVGRARIARLREQGRDPLRDEGTRQQLGASSSRRLREMYAWDREHGGVYDPVEFQREILPRLQEIPLRQMAKATGLSITYCSHIRSARLVPHARHWDTFRQLCDDWERALT